jgi:hypothetical protein
VKRPTTDIHDKPALDEGAFQQLLSAAFVLQQHKEKLQAAHEPESDFGKMLTEVVGIQEQIRNRHLDLQAATTLVARRIREITGANGAAIGILEGEDLEYFAAAGSASGELGSRAPFELSLAAECLHTGLVLRCPNAESDARLRPELCSPLNIRALIAVPILFAAKVAGVLELHFAQAGAFQEQDVRTCQLLASLLAEAIGKDKEKDKAKEAESSASAPPAETFPVDNASLRAALEKIKPQLERLAGSAAAPVAGAKPAAPSPPAKFQSPAATVCEGCGNHLAEDETFCGACGTSRHAPSTWASLWEMQRAAEKSGRPLKARTEGDASSQESLDILPSELEDIVARFSMEGDAAPAKPPQIPPPSMPAAMRKPSGQNGNGTGARMPSPQSDPPRVASARATPAPSSSPKKKDDAKVTVRVTVKDAEDESAASLPSFATQSPRGLSPATPQVPAEDGMLPGASKTAPASVSPWGSAAKTRAWLETEHGGAWLTRKWRAQRANIYLAASGALLIAVLAGLGTPSAPPTNPVNARVAGNKASHRKAPQAPPKPELSVADQLLVGLGLAEAPEPPAYTGNPEAKVWIDLHTALYYCPGSGLYGKTTGGRFTTQRDAQQDNFQSATRRACD